MKLNDVFIETPNLILKPIEHKYASVIFTEFTDEITKYMYPKPPESIDEVYDFILSSLNGLEEGSNLQLIALKRDNLEFIGCFGIHNLMDSDPELGLWTKKGAHGNGYGLEAMTELIKWAKINLEFDYLRYPVDKRNVGSRRIPERNNGIIKREFEGINQQGFKLYQVEYWIYP